MTQQLTIGFVARERFSAAARSLESIFENTRVPFKLLVVDAGTPKRYAAQIERVLRGRPNVELLRSKDVLLNNAAKNLVMRNADSDYVAIVENDNLVSDHCFQHLMDAADQLTADVVVPRIFDGQRWPGVPHFDVRFGFIHDAKDDAGKPAIRLSRDRDRKKLKQDSPAAVIQGFECHLCLFRRATFDKAKLFDESLSMRREVDESIAVFRAGLRAAVAPKAKILYLPPTFIERDERAFFRRTWDIQRAHQSHARIREKWNILEMPDSFKFLKRHRRRETYMGYVFDACQAKSAEWLKRRMRAVRPTAKAA